MVTAHDRRTYSLLWGLTIACALWLGCSEEDLRDPQGSQTPCPQGTRGCPCNDDDTCDSGLECYSGPDGGARVCDEIDGCRDLEFGCDGPFCEDETKWDDCKANAYASLDPCYEDDCDGLDDADNCALARCRSHCDAEVEATVYQCSLSYCSYEEDVHLCRVECGSGMDACYDDCGATCDPGCRDACLSTYRSCVSQEC